VNSYIDFLGNYFENTMKSYALFDEYFNLIKTNTTLFNDKITPENICVYDNNGRETDISLEGEKFGIIREEKKLTAVLVTPLYYNSQLEGYSVVLLKPYELFSGELISRKTSGDIRQHVSAIVANNTVIKTTLETVELYDECVYVDEAVDNSMKLLSAITNSEMIISMFEERDKREICDVSTIMNELLQVLKFSFGKNMTFKDEIQPNLYADIDKEQFVSSVMNLIVNSYLYNLSEEKEVCVSLKSKDNDIVVTVDDNGNGIDESYSSRFITAPKPTLTGREGLGITVAKLFAKLHGGEMNIISKGEGVGTTARITIPVCNSKEAVTMSSVKNYIKNRFSTLYLVLTKAGLKG